MTRARQKPSGALSVVDRHAPPLTFDAVTCRFGAGPTTITAVDDVSLYLEAGQLTALVGPSGSGKSTLLHLAAGMVRPTAGTVRVIEHDVAAMSAAASARMRRDTVGIVFQAYNLVPTLTAIENVTLPLEFAGAPMQQARDAATTALERVGISQPFDRYPDDLSGGEQQRVAIARAVAVPRAVVLADEPTGALDTTTSDLVMELFVEIAAAGAAVLVITHEPRVASFADRVVSLRDGRLVSDTGTPDEPERTLDLTDRDVGVTV